jgi:hypothetical protein
MHLRVSPCRPIRSGQAPGDAPRALRRKRHRKIHRLLRRKRYGQVGSNERETCSRSRRLRDGDAGTGGVRDHAWQDHAAANLHVAEVDTGRIRGCLAGSRMGSQEQENQHDSPASWSPGGSETSHGRSLSLCSCSVSTSGGYRALIFRARFIRARHKYCSRIFPATGHS